MDIFWGVDENPFSSLEGLLKEPQLPFMSIPELFWWTGDEAAVAVWKGFWPMGSIPIRIRLAFKLSFSQAWARICSAWAEVKWAGVGRG